MCLVRGEPPRTFDNPVVAVAGATGGLASAISGELVRRSRLILTGRDPARLQERSEELPGSASTLLDLGDPQAGDRLVATAQAAFGRLDDVPLRADPLRSQGPEPRRLGRRAWRRVLGGHWGCPAALRRNTGAGLLHSSTRNAALSVWLTRSRTCQAGHGWAGRTPSSPGGRDPRSVTCLAQGCPNELWPPSRPRTPVGVRCEPSSTN
jgi:hypothetical protein